MLSSLSSTIITCLGIERDPKSVMKTVSPGENEPAGAPAAMKPIAARYRYLVEK
jgi:hypothetical protein